MAGIVVAVLAMCLVEASAAVADNSMAVLPDGKVVIAGSWRGQFPLTKGAMVRFNPDGSLDQSFGVDGGVVDFRDDSPLGPISAAPDGTVLAGAGEAIGETLPANEGFLLRRYLPDGSPDPAFGKSGIAEGPTVEPGMTTFASSILSLPGDRIAIAGKAASTIPKAAAASGSVVQLFDSEGGFVETVGRLKEPMSPELRETALTDLLQRPDGSLVGLGWSNKLTPEPMLLARFLPGSGRPFDPSFAAGTGIARFQPYPQSSRLAPANAIVASGKRLVVAGGGMGGFLLTGFDQNGVLDKSFGDEGLARPPIAGFSLAEATAAAVQPDGAIVAAGRALGICPENPPAECWSIVVARFHADGSIDQGFGTDGFAKVAYSRATGLESRQIDVGVAPEGKIFVSEATDGGATPTFTVARLNPNGSIDGSFRGGVVTARPCQGSDSDLRQSGCFSKALVSLRARGLRSRSPGLRLKVQASQRLDPLSRVRLLLPPALLSRKGLANRVKAFDGDGNRLTVSRRRGRFIIDGATQPESISLVVARGALRWAKRHRAAGHKLAFRVQAWFQDTGRQTIVRRLAG